MKKSISVTSHVSRDFLQNAAYFNTLPKVIWEYVSNSIDNSKENVPLNVAVEILKNERSIAIGDNGSGMSRDDLDHFFTMHGENEQRKRGKRVRGRFGTGKSAAFGIAKSLTIETRQNRKKNTVSLNLEVIKNAKNGEPFAVRDIVVDEVTDEDDGTIIKIDDVLITKLDIDSTINFIEKHLARYRIRANVNINGHMCKYKEPPVIKSFSIFTPSEVQEKIGITKMTINVAPFSLDPDERGIDITSEGIWHETTLGDVEGKEFSDRIFGEVDFPILEVDDSEIPAFDNTRNNLLNRANPLVVIIIGWISQEVEKVRQLLVQEEKERRRTEQVKKLELQAQRMANILNEDFKDFMDELEISRRLSGKNKDRRNQIESNNGTVLPGEGTEISNWQEAGQPHGDGIKGKNPPGEGEYPRPGPNLIEGESVGSQQKIVGSGPKRRYGLFSIEFSNLTEEWPRSKYQRDERKIIINLDHPQVVFALKESGGSEDSIYFLSIVYEIAAVEYAQTIPFEKIQQGEQVDASDALFAVGDTIDRITRKFSSILIEK